MQPRSIGALVLVGLLAGAVGGQPLPEPVQPAKLIGSSPRAAARIAGARALLDREQWTEAISELQEILEESGDDLMPVDPKTANHAVSVRRLVQMQLAALPGPALRLYRGRLDDQAEKWLAQGLPVRDTSLLQKVVDDAFCSRPAETAIDQLGNLAFERGDFFEAERWWLTLALSSSESAARGKAASSGLRLLYPDPTIDLAYLRSKQILAMLFRGDRQGAIAEIKAFQKLHGNSSGQLAGENGNYVKILEALASGPARPVPGTVSWPTFAGDSSRNTAAGSMPRPRWLEEPWRVSLADGNPIPGKLERPAPITNAAEKARQLSCFPVVIGDRVVVADARSVTVLDLLTGRKQSRFDLLDDPKNAGLKIDAPLPARHGERYTLTVAGNRIYVRLGTPRMGILKEAQENDPQVGDSVLVCLQLDAQDRLAVRWQVAARQNNKETALFEGSPLVAAGRVWIARTRFNRNWATTEIDCYDELGGVRRWRREVCEALEPTDNGEPRHRQHLLCLAGPNVVYCSHSGAVVALDAATGKRAWAIRYPRRGYHTADGYPTPRDLGPPIHASGRVFVAPADSDRLLCLDALTGKTLWERSGLEVVQLLAVAHDRLILTTGSRPRGIRALDAATGGNIRHWLHPDDSSDLPTLGRGLLAGDRVVWPTVRGLRLLNIETGQLDDIDQNVLLGIEGGNLAIGNGALVIATATELRGYVSPARLLEQRRKEAVSQPGSAQALYRYAVALADAGQVEESLKTFDQAAELGRIDEDAIGTSLREEARQAAVELRLALARRQAEQGDSEWPRTLAHGWMPHRWVSTWAELAHVAEKKGQLDLAAIAWHHLLTTPRYRSELILDPNGELHRANHYAAAQIEALHRRHGSSILSRIEKHCRQYLDGQQNIRPEVSEVRLLADRAEDYPNLPKVRTALAALADQYAATGDWSGAADVHRTRVRSSLDSKEQVLALAGLARAYEGLGHWTEARQTWLRLTAEHAEAQLPGSKQSVHDHAVRQLKKPEYQSQQAGPLANVKLPLDRRWQRPSPWPGWDGHWTVPPASEPASALILVHHGDHRCDSLIAVDPATGKMRWSGILTPDWADLRHFASTLTGQPVPPWVRYHADTLLVGDDHYLRHLRLADGKLLWAIALTDPGLARDNDFQFADGRVFVLQDRRRLVAVDVESGRVLWHRWAPSARVRPGEPGGMFHPHWYTGAGRVLIQTALGVPWLLGAANGDMLPIALSRPGIWLQPPFPVNDRQVVLVPDPEHVVLFDLSAGMEIWTFTIARSTNLTGEPPGLRVAGDSLILRIARNTGYELHHLDVATGKPRWQSPIRFAPRESPDLAGAAVDGGRLYIPVGNLLRAHALADGKRLWESPLTGGAGGWQVIARKDAFVVYPRQAELEPEGASWLRRLLPLQMPADPMAGTIGRALSSSAVEARRLLRPSRCCILVIDPADGRCLERLHFPSHGPMLSVGIFPQRLVVGLASGVWAVD